MMRETETQAALDRVNERKLRIVGWFLGGVVSLNVLMEVIFRWHHWGLLGKFTAGLLVAFLIIFPTQLIQDLRKGKATSLGFLLVAAYMILMLTLNAFGRLLRY
jgi:hypothetical protein